MSVFVEVQAVDLQSLAFKCSVRFWAKTLILHNNENCQGF